MELNLRTLSKTEELANIRKAAGESELRALSFKALHLVLTANGVFDEQQKEVLTEIQQRYEAMQEFNANYAQLQDEMKLRIALFHSFAFAALLTTKLPEADAYVNRIGCVTSYDDWLENKAT